MTIEEILVQVAVAELPDLIKLGRAVYDAIEKSIGPNATQAAQSVADVEVMAGELAADVAEQAKFPKGAE